jgi:hypothetical protein
MMGEPFATERSVKLTASPTHATTFPLTNWAVGGCERPISGTISKTYVSSKRIAHQMDIDFTKKEGVFKIER